LSKLLTLYFSLLLLHLLRGWIFSVLMSPEVIYAQPSCVVWKILVRNSRLAKLRNAVTFNGILYILAVCLYIIMLGSYDSSTGTTADNNPSQNNTMPSTPLLIPNSNQTTVVSKQELTGDQTGNEIVIWAGWIWYIWLLPVTMHILLVILVWFWMYNVERDFQLAKSEQQESLATLSSSRRGTVSTINQSDLVKPKLTNFAALLNGSIPLELARKQKQIFILFWMTLLSGWPSHFYDVPGSGVCFWWLPMLTIGIFRSCASEYSLHFFYFQWNIGNHCYSKICLKDDQSSQCEKIHQEVELLAVT